MSAAFYSRRRGTTTLEFAITCPIVFFLVFAIIVGGLGVFRYQEVAALAREGARYGITANAIAPGPIETPLLMRAKELGEIGEKIVETMKAGTQLRRLGQPEEVAAAVAFLASDDASYVTGETLGVSGGLGMV